MIMTRALCTAEGCEAPRVSRWRCVEHYAYARGGCSAVDCGRPHFGGGWCKLHWKRVRRHGDPDKLRLTGVEHPGWRGDAIAYSQAHKRLRKLRGRPDRCQ